MSTLLDDLNTIARESGGLTNEIARIRRALEANEHAIKCLRKWAPECFPTDANGQIHFARALMEGVADDLEGLSEDET